MPQSADAMRNYILAKDGNRPWLLRQAFAEDATVGMVVNTDAIAFPSAFSGLDQIADVLVRRFALDFENIFTFCLTDPPAGAPRQVTCDWLVGMCARDGGAVRVG